MNHAHLTIKAVTPSLNEFLKMHWGEKKRLRASFASLILGKLHDTGYEVNKLTKPYKRKVTIISYRKRKFDFDNHVGGLKPMIDSLKDIGLIWDDGEKWIELVTRQVTDGKNPRTEIYIKGVKE